MVIAASVREGVVEGAREAIDDASTSSAVTMKGGGEEDVVATERRPMVAAHGGRP